MADRSPIRRPSKAPGGNPSAAPTGKELARDGRAHVRRPGLPYRSWRVAEAGHELAIIVRNHALHFDVELLAGDISLDRAPREESFELTVPSPDFERIRWQV